MSGRYPEIVYTEEGMREGMQIEDANIPIDAEVALLDALSETGLKRIVVGSFVSPRYTPQMARIDELMQKFHPKEGVTLRVHMCDVFARRNTNRTQMQEMAVRPKVIAKASSRVCRPLRWMAPGRGMRHSSPTRLP